MHSINCTICDPTTISQSKGLVGWTLEPSGRGTLSIISSCLATILICTWVVIHPRIDRRKTFHLANKLALFLKTLLAPEFIAVEAAQEWTQARRTVKQCGQATNGEFGFVHAFYIGMFGIRYDVPQGSKVLWPNQFVWLLEERLFDWRRCAEWGLTKELIVDKSKADAAAKLIAVLQAVWFVSQSIMRAANDLPLAPLESMTLGYIPLFVVTYVYRWVKPKDIETPSELGVLEMSDDQRATFESLSVSDAFDYEGKAEQSSYWQAWYLTPRVFEKEEQDRDLQRAIQSWEDQNQRYLAHRTTCGHQGCPACKRLRPSTMKLAPEPALAHWDPELYHSKLWPVTCLFGISFGALHLASWNTTFPSLAEAWLWRAAAITSMVTMLAFMQFERVVVCWKDPLMIVKILLPVLYILSRLAMLGGAIAAFRASDPAIYETFDVSTYWIHLL